MTMLANAEQNRAPITLVEYETRIYLYKEQIGTGYIGIGRTLNEAKAAKVVPHGQWEAWAVRTTGLDIQQVQKCMRAAREISDGSALARLEMSKALALLGSGLDKDAQETMAQQAADEGISLKALKEEIKAKQKELDDERRIAKNQYDSVYGRMLDASEWARQEHGNALAAKARADAAEADLKAAQAETARLRDQLAQQPAFAPAEGISAEAQAIIDRLRDDLEAAESREEKKAEQLQALRDQQHRQAMDDARGLATSTLTGFDLAAAVRAFIGSAGVLPQMAGSLAGISAAERRTLLENIETVAKWVDGARAALGVVVLDDSTAAVK